MSILIYSMVMRAGEGVMMLNETIQISESATTETKLGTLVRRYSDLLAHVLYDLMQALVSPLLEDQRRLKGLDFAGFGWPTFYTSPIRTFICQYSDEMDLFNSAAFDVRVNGLLSEWPVPGLAVAIVQNSTIASKAFGKANLDYARPMSVDSMFDIASSSKSLTAAGVALLVSSNAHPQVQWNSTMSSLLPGDFVMSADSYTENVTVDDILSHQSGLPDYFYSWLGIHSEHPDTPRSITRNLRNLEVTAPVRTKFMYSNMMYTVATFLIEQMTGLNFGEYLKKYFFGPLGMNSTHLQPNAAIDAGLEDRIATPYRWNDDIGSYAPIPLMQVPESQGAGSIFTSVNDYIRWVRAVMNQERPITPEIYHDLIRPRIVEDPDFDEPGDHTSPTWYAAGWEITYYRGYEIIHHGGLTSGFGSFHFFLPKFKFGGIAVGNSLWANPIGTLICYELIFDVLNIPPTEFPNWGSLPDWSSVIKRIKEAEEEEAKERREALCPGVGKDERQKKPLDVYTGRYWNGGYHGMNVEIRNGHLFINATDRSNAFTLTFDHLCDQTRYIAQFWDYYEGDYSEIVAEFRFEHGRVVKMGLQLEDEMNHLVWFDKQGSGAWTDNSFALFHGERKQIVLK